jgi:hypothetical protein
MAEALVKIDLKQRDVKGLALSETNKKIIFSPDERMFAVMKGKYLNVYSMKGEMMAQISDLMEEAPGNNNQNNDNQFR